MTMTYITNASLSIALAAIASDETLISSERVDGAWFLTVQKGA